MNEAGPQFILSILWFFGLYTRVFIETSPPSCTAIWWHRAAGSLSEFTDLLNFPKQLLWGELAAKWGFKHSLWEVTPAGPGSECILMWGPKQKHMMWKIPSESDLHTADGGEGIAGLAWMLAPVVGGFGEGLPRVQDIVCCLFCIC